MFSRARAFWLERGLGGKRLDGEGLKGEWLDGVFFGGERGAMVFLVILEIRRGFGWGP